MSDVRKVENVAEYVAYIDEARTSLRNHIETFECALVFRGQGSSSYELLPSIARDCFYKNPATGKREPIIGSLRHEADFVEGACRFLPRVFDRTMQPIDLLTCLQHYGIPTRLLDVTSNALAALYFACEDTSEEEGEVLLFRRQNYDGRDYPVSQAIAGSWQLFMTSKSLEEFASLAVSRPYFDYQRNLVMSTFPELAMQAFWFKDCCLKPMFVYGTRYLDRQTAQSGEYILFPNDIRETGDTLVFNEQITPLSKIHEIVVGRCLISPTHKKAILDELRTLGVTERSLFPDSIEKACADITREVKHRI